MAVYKAPGIYVDEISTLPPSVAEVETAIPAFIGYTEKAIRINPHDLILKPLKISSLFEYESFFGGAAAEKISVSVADDTGGGLSLVSFREPDMKYIMYHCVRMFFDNGGRSCYIVSAGTYQSVPVISLKGDKGTHKATKYGLKDALLKLEKCDDPAIIVIPEAVKLSTPGEYQTLVKAVLKQCGKLCDRFAIFDIYEGGSLLAGASLAANRAYFGSENLKYGAAYYPFIRTVLNFYLNADESNVTVTYHGSTATLGAYRNANAAVYNFVKNEFNRHFMVLPPSGAVAGVYAGTDTNRGVWKAPANISLSDVSEPIIRLNDAQQDLLNVDPDTGKSINAIRFFTGKGTLVWGARTLAGNDNEWRYVPVRRFFIMVEESVKKSTQWVVFEPNDANTWVRVKGMIDNYLNQKWRQGALMGAKPKDAYYVRCGLGETMTAGDIAEGKLIMEIGMAMVRPAEFIILKINQKVQQA